MKLRTLAALRQLEKLIVTIEVAAIAIALALMLLATAWNVVDRTFNLPWPDATSVALVAMSVVAFIGSAYAVYSGEHIVVDLGELFGAEAVRRWTILAVDVAILAFSALIIVYGKEFLFYVIQMGEATSDELALPLWFPAGCLVGGAALSILHVVSRFVQSTVGLGAGMSALPIATDRRIP